MLHKSSIETEEDRREKHLIGKTCWYKEWAKKPGIFSHKAGVVAGGGGQSGACGEAWVGHGVGPGEGAGRCMWGS